MTLPQDISYGANRKLKVLVNIILGILACVRICSEFHYWETLKPRPMNGETKTNLKIKQTRKRRKAKPERCEKGVVGCRWRRDDMQGPQGPQV